MPFAAGQTEESEVVRRIEALALDAAGDPRDRPVMLRPRDAAGQVLAGDEPPLPVQRVAVRVVRRLAEDRGRPVRLVPAQDAALGMSDQKRWRPAQTVAQDIRPGTVAMDEKSSADG
jgi:hypothetical protein